MPDASHVMWGGRFAEPMDPRLDRLNRSLPVDRRLWREDLATNRAWVHALEGVGVLTAAEREALLRGLDAVAVRLEGGAADGADDEDIHSLVERLLGEAAGPVAGKLHTGRSRNDQMATDLRLWTMGAIGRLDAALAALGRTLVARASEGLDILMPAQVVRDVWAFRGAMGDQRDSVVHTATRVPYHPIGKAEDAIAAAAFADRTNILRLMNRAAKECGLTARNFYPVDR